jgi:hypothetical protein
MSIGGDFWLDLEVRITNGTSPRTLNSFTADIQYSSEINYDGSGECAWTPNLYPSYGYSGHTASDLDGYVRLGITGNNVGTGQFDGSGWDVTAAWQRIVTIKYTIETATSVNISIDNDTDVASYFNNLHNDPEDDVTDWTMSNEDTGNVTLPVELSTFTAQYLEGIPTLYWSTSTETDNMGWLILRSNSESLSEAEYISDLIPGHGTTAETQNYFYKDIDLNVLEKDTLWYWLESIDLAGIIHKYNLSAELVINQSSDTQNGIPQVPVHFGLYQNFPNPFNPSLNSKAKILFCLQKDSQIKIDIYNVKGQLIKNLCNDNYSFDSDSPTPKMVVWDGCDIFSKKQQSGIYFCRMQVNGKDKEIRKIIVME